MPEMSSGVGVSSGMGGALGCLELLRDPGSAHSSIGMSAIQPKLVFGTTHWIARHTSKSALLGDGTSRAGSDWQP